MDWFLDKQRPDGLLGEIPWWPFVDWGKDFAFGMPPQDVDGGSSPVTLQYVEALRYAAELESRFGDQVRVQRYREAESRATAAIRKMCWNNSYGLVADTPAQKHYSQHANILGVWLDVIPAEKQKDVLTKILSTSDPGFTFPGSLPDMTEATYYFRFYLARALDHAGLGDRYLDLLKPWRDMVARGLTTWAEQPEPTRSDAHAWSAHPNFDFLTIVAGIRPKTPGFSSVTIEPHLGGLKNVVSVVPTPKGSIEASFRSDPAGVDAEIALPPNVTGGLVWKGQTMVLHAGRQHVQLP
jgi:alpha-L-rhamnosidase